MMKTVRSRACRQGARVYSASCYSAVAFETPKSTVTDGCQVQEVARAVDYPPTGRAEDGDAESAATSEVVRRISRVGR